MGAAGETAGLITAEGAAGFTAPAGAAGAGAPGRAIGEEPGAGGGGDCCATDASASAIEKRPAVSSVFIS